MFGKLLSVFAATLAVANAYTTPVSGPSGNPILTPSLGEIVPVGQPFTITWQPTTDDTVDLVLLKGPPTNVVPLYAIVTDIQNTGSYVWTPSTDLQPGTTGYGIQLICDDTGEYQYSTQFGISNPNYSSSSNSSSPSSSSAPSNATASSMPSGSALTTSASGNSSTIQPTGNMTIPSTLQTAAATTTTSMQSTTSATTSSSTGAADRMGLSVGGAVAALAIAIAAL